MANKKINELVSRTPSLSDLMLVGDPSSGYSYKCTVTALATIIETDIADGYVTLATAQTISGAKTFSNVITATTVPNTPTDPDKFLTLNSLNVITYRTGAQVLSDIGAQAALTNPVTGTGTTNYLPKFTGTSTIGNSQLIDDGTTIFLGTSGSLPNVKMIISTTSQRALELTSTTGNALFVSSGGAYVMTVTNGTWATQFTQAGRLDLGGDLSITTIANATTDTDKFLVSDAGVVKYRTGAEVLSDIGGASSSSISGTTNYIPKFTSSSAIGNSVIYESSGNIGIGTITPATPLAIKGTANNTLIEMGNSSTNSAFIQAYDRTASLFRPFTNYAEYFAWEAGGSEQMRLTSTGLGIGTSSPSEKLDVNGKAIISGNAITLRLGNATGNAGANLLIAGASTTKNWSLGVQQNVGGGLEFTPTNSNGGTTLGTTPAMLLTDAGNLGIGTSSPAYKLDVLESGATTAANSFSMARITGSDAVANDLTLIGPNTSQVRIKFGDPDDATIGEVGYNHSTNAMRFNTNGAQRMTIDASGNLGLSVTPSAWEGTDSRALQLNGGSLWSFSTSQINLLQNSYYNSSGNLIYTNNGTASAYRQYSGQHLWFTAASGTAGNAISFTQAMTLDASGRLGIGTTSPTNLIHGYVSSGSIVTVLKLENASATASSGTAISFTEGGTERAKIVSQISTGTTPYLAFENNGSERMRISSGGNVLVGTSTDSGYKLDVYGTAQIKGVSASASLNLSDTRTGGVDYTIFNGYPSVGDFTIRESGVANHLTITKTTGNATFYGSIKTAAPSGGTAKPFKIGAAAVVSPTSPNRTIEIEIDGTTYYLSAKTTND